MKVLPFPIKIYPFEIFTRGTVGISLVENDFIWIESLYHGGDGSLRDYSKSM